MLTLEIQLPLGFINTKTILELCFVTSKAKTVYTHDTQQVKVSRLHIASEIHT